MVAQCGFAANRAATGRERYRDGPSVSPFPFLRYNQIFTMRKTLLATLALLCGSIFAAEIPRKAPEFAIQLPDGKEALVSSYRGKVLCLVFILTT